MSALLRVVAHGVLGPAWLFLALGEWNRGRRVLSGLFILFSLERFMMLSLLAFDLAAPGVWTANRYLLTLVVVFEALIMIWALWIRLRTED